MDDYAAKLKKYIDEHRVNCIHYQYAQDVSDSQSCTSVVGIGMSQIIKTIVLVSDTGKYLCLILRGDCRINRDILKEQYRYHDLDLAAAHQVLKSTGYPVGGVPPFGYTAELVMDKQLADDPKGEYFAGGGSSKALIKVTPAEIMRVAKPKVLTFSK